MPSSNSFRNAVAASIRCVGERDFGWDEHTTLHIRSIGIHQMRMVTAWLNGPMVGMKKQIFSRRISGNFDKTADDIIAAATSLTRGSSCA